MTAFQTQAFIPLDGSLSITLPEHLRGKNVRLRAELETPKEEEEDAFTFFCKNFCPDDYSSMSDEEYLEGIRSLRGILKGEVDYSNLREKVDREL
jgi:hypothetical protein